MSVTDITIKSAVIINPKMVSILMPYFKNTSKNNNPVINSTIGY